MIIRNVVVVIGVFTKCLKIANEVNLAVSKAVGCTSSSYNNMLSPSIPKYFFSLIFAVFSINQSFFLVQKFSDYFRHAIFVINPNLN